MKIKQVFIILLCCVTVKCFSQTDTTKKKSHIDFFPNIGAGLIRNTIAPNFFINLELNIKDKYEFRINTSSYFLFQQDTAKKFKMYRNSFIGIEYLFHGNWSLGTNIHNNEKENDYQQGIGISYLIENKGNYFSGTTFKLYSVTKLRHVTILPELLFTDNFKTIFPGVTIRF